MSHPAALPTSAGRSAAVRPFPGRVVACAVTAVAAGLAVVALADGAGEHGDLSANDPAVTEAVVSHRTPVLTVLAQALTAIGSEVSIGLLTLVVVTWLVLRRRDVAAAAFVGGAMVVGSALTLGLKHVVGRARPPASTMLGAFDSGYSFPSGHTAFSTVFFGLVAGLLLRGATSAARRWLVGSGWVVVSAAIGASRLYLGYHWLTDVLAAWALAVGVLAVTAALVILFGRRLPDLLRPYAGRWQSPEVSSTGTESTGTESTDTRSADNRSDRRAASDARLAR
jgi:undecaprenyl-diphosphatase